MKDDASFVNNTSVINACSANGRKIHPLSFLRGKTHNVMYQEGSYYLPQIRGFIEDEVIAEIFPKFQRRPVWDKVKKSKLIESFLLNIPVTPIYLFEKQGLSGYEIVDGQQRINAINGFYSDEFELSGLESLHPLNGYKYSDCVSEIKLTLDRSEIPAYTIMYDGKSNGIKEDLDIRHNLFERLNSGGTRLTPQQLRVVAYPSYLNEIFELLSQNNHFTTAFDIPENPANIGNDTSDDFQGKNNLYASMEDCEIILRYFVLRENADVSELTSIDLDGFMKRNVDIDKSSADNMAGQFKERIGFLCDLFGEKPFDIVSEDNQSCELRKQVYEVSMVATDELWNERDSIFNDKCGVKDRLLKSKEGMNFVSAIANNGQSRKTYRDKVNLYKQILKPELKI